MRSFRFEDEDEEKTVIIKEILDPSYGCYLWPSSSVLAEYIWRKKDLFRDKTILELGAGTSLPGFLCALLSPNNHVILTDRSDVPQILENIKQAAELNGIEAAYENNNDNLEKRVWIRGLKWGEFDERGLFCLLDDLEKLGRHVDWILGSDTFYDPKDFEDLISTVAYILTFHAPPHAKFLTSYQERR
ncbi:6254_t:CDS:2 [Ambispora gerdemannii]|uniref:6254_t:CDS:1 n=1 Tax=Ambispora gerdemannii TaxID=144530 RepID=A0A9N8VAS7_9GLOM|nr:6254_t:CDS:2 [Ambispora gerdemannii]